MTVGGEMLPELLLLATDELAMVDSRVSTCVGAGAVVVGVAGGTGSSMSVGAMLNVGAVVIVGSLL